MTERHPSSSISSRLLQFIAIDVSRLLWLNTREFLPSKPVVGAECRVLTPKDIELLSRINDFGLSDQVAHSINEQNGLGIGIFVDNKLAGISFYLTHPIASPQGQRHSHFSGNTISIPPGTRSLYGAFVLPEHRGLRLHSAMVRSAINHLGTDTVHTLVTTAKLTEKAFLSSVLNQGFEKVGWTAEGVLFGNHYYRLPKPVDSLNGTVSTEEEGCIVVRPAGV